jgi:hypothetical protein
MLSALRVQIVRKENPVPQETFLLLRVILHALTALSQTPLLIPLLLLPVAP